MPQLLGLFHVGIHFPLYEKLKRELIKLNKNGEQDIPASQVQFVVVVSFPAPLPTTFL